MNLFLNHHSEIYVFIFKAGFGRVPEDNNIVKAMVYRLKERWLNKILKLAKTKTSTRIKEVISEMEDGIIEELTNKPGK